MRLETATRVLAHRGPDDQGLFVEGPVGLGHRRLSIIDLSTLGHQPMISADDRLVIVFNGEIYNYPELRRELEGSGRQFRSHSDTEVILVGFEHWGRNVLTRLNGIFACAIYDRRERSLLLARDRLGVKPLYYFHDKSGFVFGSEIKSLLALHDLPRRIDPQGFHEFLYYGNCLGTTTLFAEVKRLEPGGWLEVREGNTEQGRYWSHEELGQRSPSEIAVPDVGAETARLLELAVQRQLAADVPVGVFLSGGIDSSAITALAVRHYRDKLATFSAGFDFDGGHNELPAAAKLAKALGTEHHEIHIRGADLPETIRTLVRHHDEPFSDAANLPLFLMTQRIRECCKVILQGDGGDELFGGYNRYRLLKQRSKYRAIFATLKSLRWCLPRRRRNQVERFHAIFSETDFGLQIAKLLTVEQTNKRRPLAMLSQGWQRHLVGTDPFRRYRELAERFRDLEPTQRLFWIDSAVILPDQFLEKVDKSTMANGVEVRVPFLDNDLAAFALGLPADLKVGSGEQKKLLKQALRGIVPDEVLSRPKKGFGVPYSNWLRGSLRDFMLDAFHNSVVQSSGLFDHNELNRRIEEHRAGRDDWGFALWKAMNLALWLDEYRTSW